MLMFGLGFGVGTITKPHLLTERYGTTAYASLSGRLALPATVGQGRQPGRRPGRRTRCRVRLDDGRCHTDLPHRRRIAGRLPPPII
ncbi:hypothetical protein [Nonomuraea sp. NPDC050643]|uniref:hypothetical protein n=1 Tax=Nonomuraea sp. NPDC050643 TaxID=3155660 RepID=UPI0033D6AF2F